MADFPVFNASPHINIPKIILNTALKKEFLNICHINVQSLAARNFSKFHELKLNFIDSKVDAVCFTETWLNSSIDDAMISIDGYKLIRNDRNRHGGGICIYLRNNLLAKVVSMSPSSDPDFCGTEHLTTEIKVGNDKILLGVIYNPPTIDCTETLNEMLENCAISYSGSFFIGDFNTDLLKSSGRPRKFGEMLEALSFKCINSEPTFFHRSGASLLDLLITDAPNTVVKQDQISMPGISNHDLIFCSLRYSSNRHDDIVYYRDYVNFDSRMLFDAFHAIDWNLFFCMDNPHEMLEFLNFHLLELHDQCIPLRRKKESKNPWFNSDVSRALVERNLAYQRWKRSKTENDRNSYKRLRNKANEVITKAKTNYDRQKLKVDLPSKQLWKHINQLGISKDSRFLEQNDFSANEINDYFISNFSNDNSVCPPIDSSEGFKFEEFLEHDIINSIFSVKSNAVGLDNIPIRFVKILLPLALPIYKHLFDSIIKTSVFPRGWKNSKIIPIKKKGKSSAITNLRPISILCSLSKVFEKLIKNQISRFIDNNDLLHPYQSGFRRNHSTNSALLKVHDDISRVIDKRGVAILLLIDFAKAFDRVSHAKLVKKLAFKFSFSQSASHLIESYLSERQQAVFHNGVLSTFSSIKSGVPQGSVLGPLLFSLFINDLPGMLDFCTIHMFADDVQIYICASGNIDMNDLGRKINQDLNNILRWSRNNLLEVNPSKTKAMLICRRKNPPSPPTILFDGQIIQFFDRLDNLGLIFTENLSWDAFIISQCGKIYRTLKKLNMISRHLDTPMKLKLFKSLIFPHFIYGDFIYSNASAFALNRLRVALNSCVRYVFSLNRFEHVSHLQNKLLGCPFTTFYNFRTCVNIYKIIKTKSPRYLYSKLQFMQNRRTLSLIIPQHSSHYYGQSLFVRGIHNWNLLSPLLKSASSISGFRKGLLIEIESMQ